MRINKHYTTISIAEAHQYSQIGDSIIDSHLQATGSKNVAKELAKDDYRNFKSHLENCFIPLKELPPFAIQNYLIDHEIKNGRYIDVDLTAYKKWSEDTRNPEAVLSLLYQVQAILVIQNREKEVFTQDPKQFLQLYLQKYGIKKDGYNRLRTLFNENGLDIF